MKKVMITTIALILSCMNQSNVYSKKLVTRDYDMNTTDDVIDIKLRSDGVVGAPPNFYVITFSNLDSDVIMTKLIELGSNERIDEGFTYNRLALGDNFSVVSAQNQSTHLFRVKKQLLQKSKLILLRLRQFTEDTRADGTPIISFKKENSVRLNLIKETNAECNATPTCARLDYIDQSIYKLYQTDCIGGGVEVDAGFCI